MCYKWLIRMEWRMVSKWRREEHEWNGDSVWWGPNFVWREVTLQSKHMIFLVLSLLNILVLSPPSRHFVSRVPSSFLMLLTPLLSARPEYRSPFSKLRVRGLAALRSVLNNLHTLFKCDDELAERFSMCVWAIDYYRGLGVFLTRACPRDAPWRWVV